MIKIKYRKFKVSTFLEECININDINIRETPIEWMESLLRNNKCLFKMKEESIEVISNPNFMNLNLVQESVLNVIKYLIQNGLSFVSMLRKDSLVCYKIVMFDLNIVNKIIIGIKKIFDNEIYSN